MPKIEVRCPKCSEKGDIEINDETIRNIKRGLLAINVPAKTICPHTFVAYIDKNLKVRDYFIADFQLEMPDIELQEATKEHIIPGKDTIDLDLLKLNLTPLIFACLIKSIFFKKKTILVVEQKYLCDHMANFFEYITQNSFQADIKVLSKEHYHMNKETYKNYIVFEGPRISNDTEGIYNTKQIAIERHIINTFLSESQSSLSLVLLKNEIRKTYILASSISEFITNYEQKKKMSSKIITDYLIDAHGIKIQKDFKKYLNWLLDIVKNYFEIDAFDSSEVADFLEFI